MAGYFIYSLDWDKFQKFVNDPTDKQLLAFAKRLSEHLDGCDDELEEDDPVQDWPKEAEELCGLAKKRLAQPDWYGDLSDAGKSIWSESIWGYCCHDQPEAVGFRADHDGIYWDLIELAWKHLNFPPNEITPKVALSAFGTRPYRYIPTANANSTDDEDDHSYPWQPMHSMHTPDEVRNMLDELQTVAPAIKASKNKQAIYDYDALVPVLEQLAEEGRMLFIQVDT